MGPEIVAIIHNFGVSIFFEGGRMEAVMIEELIFFYSYIKNL